MIFNSLFTQLLIGGLAVAILIIYVKPTLAEIGSMQDSIASYEKEYNRVTEVNDTLARLVNRVNSMSVADQKALLTYMPEEVDNVEVSRDIFTISKMAEVHISTIDPVEVKGKAKTNESVNSIAPVEHGFSVSLTGTYSNVKYFLSLLEQNNYPLEVHSLKATSAGDEDRDILNVELEIITYSHI